MADFDPEAFVGENGADSQEFNPEAFVAETSGANNASMPARDKMGVGWAAIEGLADGVPGVGYLGAGLSTAKETISDITGSSMHSPGMQRTLEHWQRAKKEQEARSRKAQNDAPWMYGLSNVAGSIGSALAGGLAGKMLMAPAAAGEAAALTPAAQNVVGTMGNEAMNVAQRGNTGTEQIGGTMFGDQIVGALASKVINGTVNAASKQVIPMLLKLPQSAQEKFFHAIGDTRLAKLLANSADTPEGMALSERVRDLQSKIAAPDSLPEVAFTPLDTSIAKEPLDKLALKLGDAANKGTATLGEGASFTVTPKAGVEDELYQVGRNATENAANRTWPGSSVKAAPFMDAEAEAIHLVKKAASSSSGGRTPAQSPEFLANSRELAAMLGQDKLVGTPTKAATQDASDQLVTQAGKKIDDINFGSKMATRDRQDDMAYVIDEAKKWQAKIADAEKQMATAGDNKFERERLQGIADEAKQELKRINTGRAATRRVAGLAGGAGAIAQAGLLGSQTGNTAGKWSFDKATNSADMAAQIGARLQQWATRNDNLGRAAKWALEAPGDSAMARIIALTHLPEAQEEIGLQR